MTPLSTDAVVAGICELPSMPAVVIELIESLGKGELSSEQIAARIANDQALAATTLRLANSSFYGLSRKISTIADATTILGLRTLRQVATAAGLAGTFAAMKCPGFDFGAFWRHAIGTALCARALARALRLDEEGAFTVGLLHDVGRLALASAFPAELATALEFQRGHDCIAIDAERSVLGIDHSRVGALIAEHWRFSPEVVEAIAMHHEPRAAASNGASLADLVHVADGMAHALDLSGLPSDGVPPLAIDAWARLALDETRCHEVLREAQQQHNAVCRALMPA